jgi:diguanylate cyclase (GGDEF)-like protein
MVVRGWAGAALCGVVLLVAHLGLGIGGGRLDRPIDQWLADGLELFAAVGCGLRAAWIRRERAAWTVLGLSVLSFGVGDVLFDFVYGGNAPTPSAADPFYLAFYPGCYVALLLLVKSRISSFNRSVWLDGLIASLGTATVGAAVLFQVVLAHTSGHSVTVAVGLAYPLADIVLLGLTVFAFAVTRWRPGRDWASLGAALIMIMAADTIYLMLSANGSYSEGTLLDALWPMGLLLLAAAGWHRRDREHAIDLEGRLLGAAPIAFGLAALAVLMSDHLIRHLNPLAVWLAGATVTTVFVRTALSVGENTRLLGRARALSLTDVLSGLGNRRKLLHDLERELGRERPSAFVLVILDLNGFKGYNDRFGHPSGDTLLARLSAKLEAAFAGRATTYRLGGDEFCVLASLAENDPEAVIDAALTALTDEGEGFAITASCGAAMLPDEADDPPGALRVADERLYAHKALLYRSRGRSEDALTHVLTEHDRDAHHARQVAELAASLGARLNLSEEAIVELRLVAELHDIGKLAIPDEVLQKPGPLSSDEWDFIRRHTTVGERILAGAPAFRTIAKLVRSTHERWDGTGYPDALAGTAIPDAARIVTICDAFTAMTNPRPYRGLIAATEAIGELRRCAGTQFDPFLVEEFCRMILAQGSPSLPPAAAPPSIGGPSRA